jgi:hypothetical protein
MRAQALSPFAMNLPETRSTQLVEINGRQTVAWRGIFFTIVRGHLRSAYQQLDGETILADECSCQCNWGSEHPSHARRFSITRSVNCPINEHSIAARQFEDAETSP